MNSDEFAVYSAHGAAKRLATTPRRSRHRHDRHPVGAGRADADGALSAPYVREMRYLSFNIWPTVVCASTHRAFSRRCITAAPPYEDEDFV
jgi:hypothetical protein